ncbi:MAG: hypothetical protein FJ191_03435 [Gammaproteobacteria bacterium]|nr:hypothetical protein [Gammaproteobacteria bacterium]
MTGTSEPPDHLPAPPDADDIDLVAVWMAIRRNWFRVAAMTAVITLAAATYALLATEWYRAEVLLAPAEAPTTSAIGAQLGGLAALAGVSVGRKDAASALAVLRSRELARQFVADFDLVEVFFAKQWDSVHKKWKRDNPKKWPDQRDAVEYLHERVLSVAENPKSGLVTVTIDWTDAAVAATWANRLVAMVNAKMRARALEQAEHNIVYLSDELSTTTVVAVQQSIGRLLESELQQAMLARGNLEFAFKIVDAAEAPKRPVRPKKALIIVLGLVLGIIVSSASVLTRHVSAARQ